MFLMFALCLSVTLLTFLIHSFITRKQKLKQVYPDNALSVEVYKLVKALGQICPVGADKWELIKTLNGVPCWKRGFDFSILNSKFNVYGGSIQIPCSAKKILSVVDDVSYWKIWNKDRDYTKVTTQILLHDGLLCDKYMYYDQVLDTDPLYHRFGSMESNSVCWILTWHVLTLSWSFFICQPIDDPIVGYSCRDHSLLTMIHCSTINDIPSYLTSSLVNIRELASALKMQIRPFYLGDDNDKSDSSFVRENTSQHEESHRNKYQLLKQSRKLSKLSQSNDTPFTYTLVPFAYSKPVIVRKVAGFLLKPKYDPDAVDRGCDDVFVSHRKTKNDKRERGRHRLRTVSTSSGPAETSIPKTCRSQSVLDGRTNAPVVDRKSDSEIISKSSTATFIKSMLFGQSISRNSIDAIASNTEETLETNSADQPVDDNNSVTNSNSISSNGPGDTDSDKTLDENMSETFMSSYEMLIPSFSCVNISKFKTIGVRCVSEFLSEVCRASSIDLSSSEVSQKVATGGWFYEGFSGKEVVSLKKIGSLSGIKTLSYVTKGVIPASTEIVWKAVQNPLTRFTYDETVKKIRVLRKLDHGQKLLHMYHESSSLLKTEAQDFCILQTERVEGNKRIVAMQSVEYEGCPLTMDVVRGMLLPSGWIVDGLPQDSSGVSCSVTYLMQILVNEDDSLLLNEVLNSQPQCISNLRSYLCPDIR